MAETNEQINNHARFIWSVAELLRGDSTFGNGRFFGTCDGGIGTGKVVRPRRVVGMP